MRERYLVIGIILLFIFMSINPSIAVDNVKKSSLSVSDGNILKNYQLPLLSEKTIYVDDDNTEGPWDGTLEHPFNKVKDGVQASKDGYTIYVFSGIYREGGIDIRNSIKLIGQNRNSTIIDADRNFYGFKTVANRIVISNLTIRGTDWFRIYSSAIALISNNCLITNNIIEDNSRYGIWVYQAKFNIISKNIIRCNYGAGIFFTGSGLETSLNLFYKNHFTKNGLGVEIDCKPGFNIFKKNNFIDNSRNAYFPVSFYNFWKRNYWDDWNGKGPYIIEGKYIIYDLGGNAIVRDWINFDWHPAQKPYDIDGGDST